MASGPSPSTKETTNYARLCRLLVDVGSHALRETFDQIHPAVGLHTVLGRHPEHTTLQQLRRKKILNPTQWGKLYPTIPSSVSSAGFDITLLMVLLRNICGLTRPLTGWDSLPSASDVSKEANIARVKYFRNTIYAHASQASVDDATFNTYWQDISNALVGLGGARYRGVIDDFKNECMDPDVEEHFVLLRHWKIDEDSIKDKLEGIEVKQGTPTTDELEALGRDLGKTWKQLGRRLHFSKSELEEIDHKYQPLLEKGYQMLLRWKEREGSDATYQVLNDALKHESVQRQDLAEEYVPPEITARGIEVELAYKAALLEGKVKVCRARLLIIGQDRAGKTSLKNSLIGLPFNPEEPSTEVVKVNSSKLEVSVQQVVEWKSIDVEQARPQDRSVARLIAEHMTQETEGNQALLEEDKGANDVKEAIGPAQLHGLPATSKTPAPSLTQDSQKNPTQKPSISMPKELHPLVTEYLRNPNTQSDESSATETVLDVWDFAGQHLYYATQPIFFSPSAVYLLVHNFLKNPHDLAKPSFKSKGHTTLLKNTSNETNLDMLLSWLVSVHSLRRPPTDPNFVETCKSSLGCLPPPVLVVGTHADKVSSQDMKQVESQIISSIEGKTYEKHVLLPFYRVDNTRSSDSPNVKEIQTRVQQILSSGLNSTADLPVKWFNFEKAVKNLAGEKFFMTLEEIRQIAQQECFIDDDKQLDAMLNYYHDLGLIVRFKDTVVLDTQWLINLFQNLITTCPFQEQVGAVDRDLWRELKKTGVLDMQLIDKVFEDLPGNERKSLQQSILDMMENYGFLAKFHHHKESDDQPSNSSSEVKYFVPAQLCESGPELWRLTPQDSDPCALVFNFCDGFVPHGLFPQLVSRLVTLSPKLECTQVPKLYLNGVHFILGKKGQFDLVLLRSKRCIKLVLKGYPDVSTNSEQVAENSLAIQVRTLIEEELEHLCRQWHWLGNVRCEVCVTCCACTSSGVQCERHKAASCSDQDCIHLLPISSVTVEPVTSFTCPEQVGDHSRFTLTNLHKWYPCSTPEEKPTENRKLARISDIKFDYLADEIPVFEWKVIGRLLGLKNSRIDQIAVDNERSVYEQRFQMLMAWKGSQLDSNATCEQLKQALSDKLVRRNDLVQCYCYQLSSAELEN